MVWELNCECEERIETTIDSLRTFKDVKAFFEEQVQRKVFSEEVPQMPYYVWREGERVKEWFATKWYRCNVCGCLWELNYPDFPAKGFVRKFSDGIYKERGY